MIGQKSKKILDGYRVIDASRILVGAFGSMMLADLGAEVIKIEQPGMGDETRKWGPPFRGPDSTYFISINRNKQSLTLDLKSPQGLSILHDLVGKSDIFLTNFVPSQVLKLGLDYPSLSKFNEKLIYGSVQGFPQDSLLKNKAAFDLTIQAMSGLMHCTGDPDGSPFKVGYAVTDILTGMTLLQGIMGAIIHRERTGEGQEINTSLLEANLFSLSYVVSSWLNGKTEYKRMGNSHPNIAPYSVYRTKDQEYIVIGVATDSQFEKFSEILGIDSQLPEYKTNRDRCLNRDRLNLEIQAHLTLKWNLATLVEAMKAKTIPFSEIKSVKQLFEDPELKHMSLTNKVSSSKYSNNGEYEHLEFPKNPIHYSKSENAQMSEPALLGEHNDSILRGLLGYSEEKKSDEEIVGSSQIQHFNNELNNQTGKPNISVVASLSPLLTNSQASSQHPLIEPEVLQKIKFLQVTERKGWQGVNALYCGIPGKGKPFLFVKFYIQEYIEASEKVFDILRELHDLIVYPSIQKNKQSFGSSDPSQKSSTKTIDEKLGDYSKPEESYAFTDTNYVKFKFQELLMKSPLLNTGDVYSEQTIQKINSLNFKQTMNPADQAALQLNHMHPSYIQANNALSSKYVTYKILKCDAKLVRFMFDLNGLVPTDRHDWHLLWTNTQGAAKQQSTTYFYERLTANQQKVNHFPLSNELTRKDKMAINIKQMQLKYAHHYFNFIPETFVLPEEFQQFEFAFYRRIGQNNRAQYSGGAQIMGMAGQLQKNLWIVKPSGSSRGRGIYIIDNPKQIAKGGSESLVVSRYIESPLLLYGHKFDLRIYVVVTCYDPLRVYVYREGLVRFASEKYDLSKACASGPQSTAAPNVQEQQASKYSHLTNYSINKKNDKYVQNEKSEDDDSGFKWSLSAMNEHFEQQGIDINLMWSKIYDVIIKSLLAVEEKIKIQFKSANIHRSSCYELFGYDILLDSNLDPWLLEVNLSPSLAFDSPLDLKIKGNLLKDTFNLVGVRKPTDFQQMPLQSPSQSVANSPEPKEKKKSTQQANNAQIPSSQQKHQQRGTPGTTMKPQGDTQNVQQQQQNVTGVQQKIIAEIDRQMRQADEALANAEQRDYICYFAQLTIKQKEILLESLLEFQRRGNFTRIYPSKNTDFYDCFLSPLGKSGQQLLYQGLHSEAISYFTDAKKLKIYLLSRVPQMLALKRHSQHDVIALKQNSLPLVNGMNQTNSVFEKFKHRMDQRQILKVEDEQEEQLVVQDEDENQKIKQKQTFDLLENHVSYKQSGLSVTHQNSLQSLGDTKQAIKEMYIILYEYLRRYDLKVHNALKADATKYNFQIKGLIFNQRIWHSLEDFGSVLGMDQLSKTTSKFQIPGNSEQKSQKSVMQGFGNSSFLKILYNRIELLKKYISMTKYREQQAEKAFGGIGPYPHAPGGGGGPTRSYVEMNKTMNKKLFQSSNSSMISMQTAQNKMLKGVTVKHLLLKSKNFTNQELTEQLATKVTAHMLNNNQAADIQQDAEHNLFKADCLYQIQSNSDNPSIKANNLLDMMSLSNMQLITQSDDKHLQTTIWKDASAKALDVGVLTTSLENSQERLIPAVTHMEHLQQERKKRNATSLKSVQQEQQIIDSRYRLMSQHIKQVDNAGEDDDKVQNNNNTRLRRRNNIDHNTLEQQNFYPPLPNSRLLQQHLISQPDDNTPIHITTTSRKNEIVYAVLNRELQSSLDKQQNEDLFKSIPKSHLSTSSNYNIKNFESKTNTFQQILQTNTNYTLKAQSKQFIKLNNQMRYVTNKNIAQTHLAAQILKNSHQDLDQAKILFLEHGSSSTQIGFSPQRNKERSGSHKGVMHTFYGGGGAMLNQTRFKNGGSVSLAPIVWHS